MVLKAIFGNTSNDFVCSSPSLSGAVENSKEKILTYCFGAGDVTNFHAIKPWEKDGNKTLFYYGKQKRNCLILAGWAEN